MVCTRQARILSGADRLRKLPLNAIHIQAGARFGPFGGYEMPLFYPAGTIREHLHTRERAGLFDISHMLFVEVAGPGAATLIAALCPYPAGEHPFNRARYTFFLNEHAGIVDDLIVARLDENRFRIVCNAGCADKDLEHIRHFAPKFDVTLQPLSLVFLALQGPESESVLAACGMDVAGLGFLDIVEPRNGWMLSRSGYTGEDGFEIAMPPDKAEEFAARLLSDDRVMLCGLAARDTLRLEAGLPLYGQDLTADITPMEAGLAWAIPRSHREGGDFVGAVALGQKFLAGPARKRIGLRPEGQSPVRAHAQIFDAGGDAIGEVTSGGFGPSVGHPVAMGLVESEFAAPIHAERRGNRVGLKIVPLPFVAHRYRK
jgi:glycine cleavage system T protein (aminomethyltransferase)